MSNRAKTFWIPALASLTGSMAWMAILQRSFPRSEPLLNHAWGAYLSRRAGGECRARLAASLFPAIAMAGLVGFLTLIGQFVFARPKLLYLSTALLFGVILPGIALLMGAAPFVKTSRGSRNPKQQLAGSQA